MTQQLRELAQWLAEAKVTAVAMEATRIYWVTVWNVLEPHGFELLLVNPERYKAVRGKKTDLKDGKGSPNSCKMDDWQAVMYLRWRSGSCAI